MLAQREGSVGLEEHVVFVFLLAKYREGGREPREPGHPRVVDGHTGQVGRHVDYLNKKN